MRTSFTYADRERCPVPPHESYGIKRFKHVEHHHDSPRELDGPVTGNVPNKGARVEVGRNGTGQGRGDGDVGEQRHQRHRNDP